MTRPGLRGGPGQGGPGGGTGFGAQHSGSGKTSMGIAFVKVNGTFEPRLVHTGSSDWDYVEVLKGLEEGEEIALLPSAQLYMENEQMMERFRSRSSVVGSSRSR